MSTETTVDEGFVAVCALTDLEADQPLQVVVEGKYIALIHTEGEVFAILDRCSHADVALSEGDVDECHIECWMHGSRFDLRTGIPDSPPAVAAVPVYPVRVEGEGPNATVLINVNAA